ncbi:hypothetical protein EYC84_004381 [Monilinia fructicola]|uniref:Uncharacterized protein n=1 Tax=Monilinia fructicola TaxID=38448 RepID=A0A5M9K065_MONFR|nr:hypothetical protein EYC84_004381 [Monilinia fructicola]
MASKTTEGFALVSGAGSGIEKNTAFSLAEPGATSILSADTNFQGAQEAAAESKKYASSPLGRTLAIHVDASSEESVQASHDRRRHSRIRESG